MSSSQRTRSQSPLDLESTSPTLQLLDAYQNIDPAVFNSEDFFFTIPFSTQRWFNFNPFDTDSGSQQEDPGLQIGALPDNSKDLFELAKAVYRADPRYALFQFKKETSLAVRMRVVIRICEQAIDKNIIENQTKMTARDLAQNERKNKKFSEAFARALAKDRLYRKGKGPRASQRLLLKERIKTAVEAMEFDSQLTQVETLWQLAIDAETREQLALKPGASPHSFFAMPSTPPQPEREMDDLDKDFLATADQYIQLARKKMGNLICPNGGMQVETFFVQDPVTARDLFELAYAIMDGSKIYKGAPVGWDISHNSWAVKYFKSEQAEDFLGRIPADSDFFLNNETQYGQLICAITSMKEMMASYVEIRDNKEQVSLEQIQIANETEQTILKLFENLSKVWPPEEEEKQAAPEPAPAPTAPRPRARSCSF